MLGSMVGADFDILYVKYKRRYEHTTPIIAMVLPAPATAIDFHAIHQPRQIPIAPPGLTEEDKTKAQRLLPGDCDVLL